MQVHLVLVLWCTSAVFRGGVAGCCGENASVMMMMMIYSNRKITTKIGKADELPVHNRKGVGNQTNRGRVHLVIRLLAKVTTKFGPPLPPSPPTPASPQGGEGGQDYGYLFAV